MSQSGDNPTLQPVTLGLGECAPHHCDALPSSLLQIPGDKAIA